LLFTRTAQQEAACKSFASNQKNIDRKIASKLIHHAQDQARKTGLPLFTAYGHQQTGDTFGERLSNEVTNLFHKGFEQLIIIGNDCLDLNAPLILHAAESCHSSKMVLGPAKDGGLYLIGLHRQHFNQAQFAQLDWEKASLQDSFAAYLQSQKIDTLLLPTYEDIDNSIDFYRLVHQLMESHILKRDFIRLLAPKPLHIFEVIQIAYRIFYTCLFQLRAPPLVLERV